ncbi:putative protein ImpA [Candidatus Paraburkholderia schumanniana]|nr:putative protein ImpA [Candidatus Paraburkholderia schumannianae]
MNIKENQAAVPLVHDWTASVSPEAPCGVDLEYDLEFVVLCAQLAARIEAQYGDFVETPEPVNWSDIDRECRRLMHRSKDIRLAIIFARCRTRLAGAAGLAEGLGLLATWLEAFPDTIHPQPDVDDQQAAVQIRMNALQVLTDAEGLFADVRDIILARASVAHLRVRDVEREFAFSPASDALSRDSVIRQLGDLRMQQLATLDGFESARASLRSIDAWGRDVLGEHHPDLRALMRVLGHVLDTGMRSAESEARPEAHGSVGTVDHASRDPRHADPVTQAVDTSSQYSFHKHTRAPIVTLEDRSAALNKMREAQLWFEQYEPGSPISVLLLRAEQCVGRRYTEVTKAVPPDLIAQRERDCL